MDTLSSRLAAADLLRQQGQLAQAAALYADLWREQPDCAPAAFQLGTLALSASDPRAALPVLEAAVRLSPNSPDYRNNLAAAHKELGHLSAAESEWQTALQLDPAYAPAVANLAELAQLQGDIPRATTLFAQALELDPTDAQSAKLLGDILLDRDQFAAAEQCYLQAHTHQFGDQSEFDQLDLLSRIGLARLKQEKLAEAESLFRLILVSRPDLAEIHANLCFVLERQGKIAAAITAGREALRLKPDLRLAYNNLAIALRADHQFHAARHLLAQALLTHPGEPLTEFNHGTICLQLGDYEAGWPGYEFRNQTVSLLPRTFAAPAWSGTAQPGGTLLIHPEQGFGDSIQFARLLDQAKQQFAGRLVLECPPELFDLFQSLPGVDELIRAGDPLPPYDAHLSLASLPGRLGLRFDDLAETRPYLHASPGLRALWSARLDELTSQKPGAPVSPRPRIGLVWQGNPKQAQDIHRSCPLATLLPLVRSLDADWFSLQKGPKGEAQLANLPKDIPSDLPLIPLGPELASFADTAAVIAELDLLISVDTSIVHLAGAMGRPVWTLLAHTPDWRWEIDSSTSAWYPTMRLFRPDHYGDWSSLVTQLTRALHTRFPAQTRRAA
jgi:Flp pilus assembly protein TadD